jgi:hypothetical protein
VEQTGGRPPHTQQQWSHLTNNDEFDRKMDHHCYDHNNKQTNNHINNNKS